RNQQKRRSLLRKNRQKKKPPKKNLRANRKLLPSPSRNLKSRRKRSRNLACSDDKSELARVIRYPERCHHKKAQGSMPVALPTTLILPWAVILLPLGGNTSIKTSAYAFAESIADCRRVFG